MNEQASEQENEEEGDDIPPPEVEQEFQSQLDVCSNAWEQDLRDHLEAISAHESVESLDESKISSLVLKATQIMFDPQTGIYP